MTATAASRPRWADPAATALIPLRPLTVGEVLDAAFLVVRRDLGGLLAVPFLFTGLVVAAVASVALLWTVVPDSVTKVMVLVLLVLGWLAVIGAVYVWVGTLVCRSALRTLMGAEADRDARGLTSDKALDRRIRLGLFWPALGISVMVAVFGLGVAYLMQLVVQGVVLIGLTMNASDETVLVGFVVSLLTTLWPVSFVVTAVPVYVAEGRYAPVWAGRPDEPTSAVLAIFRAVALVGWRGSLRVTLVLAATIGGAIILVTLMTLGVLLLVMLYMLGLGLQLTGEVVVVTLLVGYAISAGVALSVFIAYWAALQAVIYLDCRMRREGLDVGFRFAAVPVPQPNSKVVV